MYLYIYAAVSKEKLKPRRFSLIRLLFAHHANRSCHLAVCLRRNKQKSSVCKQTKQTEQTCLSMEIT